MKLNSQSTQCWRIKLKIKSNKKWQKQWPESTCQPRVRRSGQLHKKINQNKLWSPIPSKLNVGGWNYKKKDKKKPPKSTKQTHDPRGKTKKTS